VSAEATVTGSFAEHVKSLNDRMIADATTRTTDMASLTSKLQTIADAQALEITRLGNSVDALNLELQRTTGEALRREVQRRLDREVADLNEVKTSKSHTDGKRDATKHEEKKIEKTKEAAKSLKAKTGK
jgi:type II secretory pathway component PulM